MKEIVIISSLWPAFAYSSVLYCGQSLNLSHSFFKASVLSSFIESIQGIPKSQIRSEIVVT